MSPDGTDISLTDYTIYEDIHRAPAAWMTLHAHEFVSSASEFRQHFFSKVRLWLMNTEVG